MKTKLALLFGLLMTMNTARASDLPPMKCTIYSGMYGICHVRDDGGMDFGDKCKLAEWDSQKEPPSRFKYDGKFKNDTVDMYWGVNVGASASPNSQDRFEIFGYPMKNGVYADFRVVADTDATKPIDLALYVPVADVSIVCKNY